MFSILRFPTNESKFWDFPEVKNIFFFNFEIFRVLHNILRFSRKFPKFRFFQLWDCNQQIKKIWLSRNSEFCFQVLECCVIFGDFQETFSFFSIVRFAKNFFFVYFCIQLWDFVFYNSCAGRSTFAPPNGLRSYDGFCPAEIKTWNWQTCFGWWNYYFFGIVECEKNQNLRSVWRTKEKTRHMLGAL